MTRHADPHQTLWVLDLPWWERPHEFLTPLQIQHLEIRRLRVAGYEITVQRGPGAKVRPRTPKLGDVWYARKEDRIVPNERMNRRIAESLWRQGGGICGYCRRPTYVRAMGETTRNGAIVANIEHREPISSGGSWKRFNLLSVCRNCNAAKGDLDEVTFRTFLDYYPPEPSGRFIAQIKGAARREMGRRDRERNARLQSGPGPSPSESFEVP